MRTIYLYRMAKRRRSSPAVPTSTAPARAPWYRTKWIQAVLVALLGFGLYVNTFGHDFALDDAIVLTDNAFTQQGVAGIDELFAYDTFRGFYEDDRGVSLVQGGRYRPLTPALFALEKSLGFGAGGHHVMNALWYALLSGVVFGFVGALARGRGLPWWFALAVAALFAAHPLHTEAVANIKGRDEILAALGAIGSVWLVLRAERRGSILGAVAGAVVFLIGCLAKENTITFFAVIPLVLWWFGSGAGVGKKLGFFLPVAVAAAVFLALRTAVIGTGLGGAPVRELMNNPFLVYEGGQYVATGTGERLATVFHTLWRYLVLLVAPFELVHDYYPRAVAVKSWGQPTPWLGLLLHLGLAAAAVRYHRSRPLFALGVVAYLAALSVVSNLVFPVGTNMSERFLFLPSFGFILAGVAGLVYLTRRFGNWLAWSVLAAVLLFSVLTVLRNPAWKDDFTLFTTDVRKQPDSAKLLNAAAGARLARYAEQQRAGANPDPTLVSTALNELDRALTIHPLYRNAYQLRGNAKFYRGDYDAAIADYDRADELAGGGNPGIIRNLVIALTTAAEEGGKAGKPLPEINAYLQRAEQLAPDDYEVLRLRGVANGMAGNTAAALNYFERALAARPDDADAAWNYGIALYQTGRTAEAEQQFTRAEQLQPGIRAEKGR